jgi:serine/threonine protein phosphatase PrpC
VSRTSLKKTTDDLLILACDGVWEVMEDQEAVSASYTHCAPHLALELMPCTSCVLHRVCRLIS